MNFLQFDGYCLRAPEPEDLDCMLQFENTPALWEVGCASGPYSRYHLKQYIETTRNDLYSDRQLRLMVESSDHVVAGIVDLFNFDPFHNRAEVGIVIAENFRCQGIGLGALKCLIHHAFNHLGLHQLVAHIDVSNVASRKLFLKSGFTESACLKDWIRKGEEYYDVILLQLQASSLR